MGAGFSYSVSGLSRFRGSAIVQRGSYDVVLRVVPLRCRVEELGLEVVKISRRHEVWCW